MNENKKSDGESVCNLFGLSPVLFSGSVTDEQYNNAIKTAVLPILDAMTEAYNKAMLLESEKDSLYFEIDTRTLLKGDIEKRFSAYKLAAEANIMQLDEIRKRENLPALGMNFIKLGLQDVLYNPKPARSLPRIPASKQTSGTVDCRMWKIVIYWSREKILIVEQMDVIHSAPEAEEKREKPNMHHRRREITGAFSSVRKPIRD